MRTQVSKRQAAKKRPPIQRSKKMPTPKKSFEFTKGAKKEGILYTHVKEVNKEFVHAAAKAENLSASDWMDQLLDQLRTKKMV
jgi:hypothetical protein